MHNNIYNKTNKKYPAQEFAIFPAHQLKKKRCWKNIRFVTPSPSTPTPLRPLTPNNHLSPLSGL